ncbi:MAG: hypothetical protein ACM3SV_01125 [Betaproteobacteria bacterium]
MNKPLSFTRPILLLLAALGANLLTANATLATTPPEIAAALQKIQPISIEAAFKQKAIALADAQNGIDMDPERLPMVKIGGQNLLAAPMVIPKSSGGILHIRSFVTSAPDGKYTMYYPIISLVNERMEIFKTLKPKVDFNFNGQNLINEFDLPEGATRLLIHTHDEYFKSDFSSVTYLGDPSADPMKLKFSLSPVLLLGGGLLGALAVQIMTGTNNEFTFSEVGVISVLGP